MTKKKFISDYTERFGFYMLEGYSDTVAVEKMLGEVYDKMKRPTREEYKLFTSKLARELYEYQHLRESDGFPVFSIISEEIYYKYLSDSNGGDSEDTVSDNTVRKCNRCRAITPRGKIHVCELSE